MPLIVLLVIYMLVILQFFVCVLIPVEAQWESLDYSATVTKTL